jgi:hypothetical protein
VSDYRIFTEFTRTKWLAHFGSWDFNLNEKGRPGRQIEANDSILEELLEQDPQSSTKDSQLN